MRSLSVVHNCHRPTQEPHDADRAPLDCSPHSLVPRGCHGPRGHPPRPRAPRPASGGVGYVAYQFNVAKDTLTADSSIHHINNFDITRAYINVNGALRRWRRDPRDRPTSSPAAPPAACTPSGSSTPTSPGTPDSSHLTYKIGAIHTPWLDWEEALWDYRMQGQMAMERAGVPLVVRLRPRRGRQVGLRPLQLPGGPLQRRELQRHRTGRPAQGLQRPRVVSRREHQ